MAIPPTDIQILFTNYEIIAYFLNLASCSKHFIRIKHRILATFNINKKNSILTACMPLIMQKIISELCPFNNVLFVLRADCASLIRSCNNKNLVAIYSTTCTACASLDTVESYKEI